MSASTSASATAFEGGRRRLVRRGRRGALPRPDYDPADYEKVDDILDVWFDSGSTHAYVLEDPVHFPASPASGASVDGGADEVMYLEGSDQHRGWFQSSLLESCGTRGRAPYDVVLTHGFTLDEKGRKMSKSLGNQTFPQDVIKPSGADILRLWTASVDYSDDQRIGPEILKTRQRQLPQAAQHHALDAGHARPLRPRGAVGVAGDGRRRAADAASAQRTRRIVRDAYADFDSRASSRRCRVHEHRPVGVLFRHPQGRALLRADLERRSGSARWRRSAHLPRGDHLARADPGLHLPKKRGPSRDPSAAQCISSNSPLLPAIWRDEALAPLGDDPPVASVVTGAMEIARARRRRSARRSRRARASSSPIGEPLRPSRGRLRRICITSDIALERCGSPRRTPSGCPTSPASPSSWSGRMGLSVRARGAISTPTADPEYPDITPRDAKAMRELRRAGA